MSVQLLKSDVVGHRLRFVDLVRSESRVALRHLVAYLPYLVSLIPLPRT